jgi:hypothetical protein
MPDSQAGNKIGLMARFNQALADDWFRRAKPASRTATSPTKAPAAETRVAILMCWRTATDRGQGLLGRFQLLAPYFGLGYRKLSSDLRGLTTTGDTGYRRHSQDAVSALGVTHRIALGSQARLSTSVEYDLLLEGRQRFMLSDTNASSDDPVSGQRRGYGLRMSSSYETDHWSLGFFVHVWRVGASDAARQSLGERQARWSKNPAIAPAKPVCSCGCASLNSHAQGLQWARRQGVKGQTGSCIARARGSFAPYP